MSLSDAALIKDNHVAAAGSVAAAFAAVRSQAPGLPLEVECDTLEQVAEALAAGADLILLDNFTVPDMAAGRPAGRRPGAAGGQRRAYAGQRPCGRGDWRGLPCGRGADPFAPALDIGLDLVPAS